MKTFYRAILVSLLTGLSVTTTSAQSTETAIKPFTIKKGIYYSFRQIMTENPALTDSLVIKERSNSDIILVGGGKYTFELLNRGQRESRKIRDSCIGFSDGNDFYISTRYTTKVKFGYTKCMLSGPYIISIDAGNAGQYTGGGLIPSAIKTGKGYLVNIKDKTSKPLSAKLIRSLLKKYPDLQEQYSNKQEIMDDVVEILEKINEREKI